MSRIGKMPVPIPAKVEVKLGDNNAITVKGPKGELSAKMPYQMTISQEDGEIVIKRPNDERKHRELHGLTRALINNMVTGVSEGFRKSLQIQGVGYRSEMNGKTLVLHVGYSHPHEVEPPEGISFSVEERGTLIHIDGIDRQVVGQVASNIREIRPPEPYKGKGIRYLGEYVRMKAGKAGKTK